MRIRQFIAALMVLLSLTVQSRTVFACAMMPGDAIAHCCCSDDGKNRCPPTVSGSTCCDQVAPADAPLGEAAAVQHAGQPSIAWGPAPHLLPAAFDTGDRRPPHPGHAATPQHPLPLYLLTARLRL